MVNKKIKNKPFYRKPEWFIPIVIAIILTIISIAISNLENKDTIVVKGSTLIKSPIIKDSHNVIIAFNDEKNIPNEKIYSAWTGINLFHDITELGGKVNLYNVEVVLPDTQIAFLKELMFNTTYKLGQCNQEFTDCYIYNKFEIPKGLDSNQICFKVEKISDRDARIIPQTKFVIDPESCYSPYKKK